MDGKGVICRYARYSRNDAHFAIPFLGDYLRWLLSVEWLND